jgi:acetate kinase
MLASLGGVDALAFTAGVGEHAASVRAAACEAFAFLGMKLDSEKNARSSLDSDIATADSKVRVLVITPKKTGRSPANVGNSLMPRKKRKDNND